MAAVIWRSCAHPCPTLFSSDVAHPFLIRRRAPKPHLCRTLLHVCPAHARETLGSHSRKQSTARALRARCEAAISAERALTCFCQASRQSGRLPRKSGGKVVRQRAHAWSTSRVTVGSSRVSPNCATDDVLDGAAWPQQVTTLVHLLQRRAEVVVIPVVREHKVLVEPSCVRVAGGPLDSDSFGQPVGGCCCCFGH